MTTRSRRRPASRCLRRPSARHQRSKATTASTSATAGDDTPIRPTLATGIASSFLAPDAAATTTLGAAGSRWAASAWATARITYKDARAEISHDEEMQAILLPLDEHLDLDTHGHGAGRRDGCGSDPGRCGVRAAGHADQGAQVVDRSRTGVGRSAGAIQDVDDPGEQGAEAVRAGRRGSVGLPGPLPGGSG